MTARQCRELRLVVAEHIVAIWVALGAYSVAGSSATGLAASADAPTATASTNGFVPFVFIHAGDTELGSPDLPGTSQRLRLLAERANTIGAARVVIAGDLLHDSTDPDERKALDECLEVFKMPVYAVPGNHDDLAEFRERFGKEDAVFAFNNCVFVCLNSNDLSPAALSRLRDSLEAARRQKRTHVFLVMHHPPAADSAVITVCRNYGVKAILCGHFHTTGSQAHGDCVTYWVSGTAKARDENGLRYNVFKVHEDRVEQVSLPLEQAVGRMTPPPHEAKP